MSRNDSKFDTYYIPPNFIEGGTVMGGLFKLRNIIEAGILALFVVMPIFMLNFDKSFGDLRGLMEMHGVE